MESTKIDKKITDFYINKDLFDEEENKGVIVTDVKLPDDAPARMKTLRAEGKKWYLTVVYYNGSEKPFALFCTTNHREKTAQTFDAVERMISLARNKGILEEHITQLEEKINNDSNVNKLTRTISLLLRHNVPIRDVVQTIDSMDSVFVGSFLFQIKKFLSQYIKDGEPAEGMQCQECGSTNLVFSEGCVMCRDCQSSKCG